MIHGWRPSAAPMACHPDWSKDRRVGHDDGVSSASVDDRVRQLRPALRGYEWREIDVRAVLAAILPA
jgi:hypothetical protein